MVYQLENCNSILQHVGYCCFENDACETKCSNGYFQIIELKNQQCLRKTAMRACGFRVSSHEILCQMRSARAVKQNRQEG